MIRILFLIQLFGIPIFTKSQGVDFTYKSPDGLFCTPSSIHFTQISSGNPTGFAWDFGDGNYSNVSNPVAIYKTPGSYTVKLVVIYELYATELSKTIRISPSITAAIQTDRNFICKPGAIHFKGISNGNIRSYYWDFGDGTGSVTSSTDMISHNFTRPGIYNVTMKAVDITGCFAITNTQITIQNFTITGSVSPVNGCIPAKADFTANATLPVNSTITSYTWNFKDGSPIETTTTNAVSHIYNVPGRYSPTVSITTSDGCNNIYTFDSLAFGLPPVNTIAYTANRTICGSEKAAFISKATNANSYHWNFGDGDSVIVKDTVTEHKFKTLGVKTVTVTPIYNGCRGVPQTVEINVIGVIASYDYSNTCSDKKTFSLINTSQGNQSSMNWNFGDGTQLTNANSIKHTFPASGEFITSLTVTDNNTGCSDTYAEKIYTAVPVLKNPDTAICRNSSSVFTIANNYTNPAAKYTWNALGNPASATSSANHSAPGNTFGYYYNAVIINNGKQYCPDTIPLKHRMLVRGPIIDFTAPDTICLNNKYQVNNTSRPYITTDYINSWVWNFETGSIKTDQQPQSYLYKDDGVKEVKLLGRDINGCTDSLRKNVTVKVSPFIRAIPGIDTLCAGESIKLIAFNNDPVVWSPADLVSCVTCDTVMAKPSVSTKFYVTATNELNCSSTDSISVKVYEPFVAVPPTSELAICSTQTIRLSMGPSDKKIAWTPSFQMPNSNIYEPAVSPSSSTIYTATLSDSAGCFTSKADVSVIVKTLPVVNAGPDKTYPYNSNFKLSPTYSNNVLQYAWSPGANFGCSNCPEPEAISRVSTKYTIQVTSDSGCVARDTINIFVACNDANILLPNAFTPNSDHLNDYFYPTTRGIKSISRFSVYNRYGKLIFDAKNIPPNHRHLGWDGKTQNADQSTSVYVYVVEAICDVGEKIYAKGSVVLIR